MKFSTENILCVLWFLVRFPTEVIFSFLQSIQTGNGAHSVFYLVVIGRFLLKGKAVGGEAENSPPVFRAKRSGAIPPIPHLLSWHAEGQLHFNLY
jgi:hypothetical protein